MRIQRSTVQYHSSLSLFDFFIVRLWFLKVPATESLSKVRRGDQVRPPAPQGRTRGREAERLLFRRLRGRVTGQGRRGRLERPRPCWCFNCRTSCWRWKGKWVDGRLCQQSLLSESEFWPRHGSGEDEVIEVDTKRRVLLKEAERLEETEGKVVGNTILSSKVS